jgi:hypothetical protein
MSALPSEADIRVGLQHVCFVPKSDVTPRQQESGDQWFGQRQAAEALFERLDQGPRRERLCEIGEAPGLMRSRADDRAVVPSHVDDRHRIAIRLETMPQLDA